MQRRYSVSFFIILIAFVLSLSWIYYESYETVKQREDQNQESVDESTLLKDESGNTSQSVDGRDVQAKSPDSGYYLKEEHGYVVVYLFDGKTIYEETTIKVKDLDEELQEEIQNVKYLETTAELYGFLENYSS